MRSASFGHEERDPFRLTLRTSQWSDAPLSYGVVSMMHGRYIFGTRHGRRDRDLDETS